MHQCRSSLFFGELWQGQKRIHRSLVIFPVKVDGANTPVCSWISPRKGRWHKCTSPWRGSLFKFTSEFSKNYPCVMHVQNISVAPAAGKMMFYAIYFKWRNELWEIMGDFLAMIWDIFPEKDGAIYTLFCYDGTVPSTPTAVYNHHDHFAF